MFELRTVISPHHRDSYKVDRPLEQVVLDATMCPSWLRAVLSTLATACSEAWVTGDAYFNPYFAGRFGPELFPLEIEVGAPDGTDAQQLLARLRRRAPTYRWAAAHLAPAGVAAGALVAGCGRLMLLKGLPTYCFDNRAARHHLEQGLLVPCAGREADAKPQALALVSRYPGLRADFLRYEGKRMSVRYEEIDALIRDQEYGGRRRRGFEFSEEERPVAEAIRQWHRTTQPKASPVPVPAAHRLPSDEPWTAPDAEFRAWIIDQTLSTNRASDPDGCLHAALDAQRGSEQKPTHQGWETWQHVVYALIALETDQLEPADRRAVRVAMLFHDIGKLRNIWTPGCHALVGAKVWLRFSQFDLRNDEVDLISSLIRTHDILALLDRGIMRDDFRGAVSPAEIRQLLANFGRSLPEALALMRAVYRADIGSVPTLRWLLPLVPLLEEVVLAGSE